MATFQPGACPSCGAELSVAYWTELPLLRHGGYGAGRFHRRHYCRSCPFDVIVEVSEVRA